MLAFEHTKGLKRLTQETTNTTKLRNLGTIAAFDINGKDVSQHLKATFQEHGLLLRPQGNTIYMVPPYCVTQEQIRSTYDKIIDICNEL